jgi:hypothetical protein
MTIKKITSRTNVKNPTQTKWCGLMLEPHRSIGDLFTRPEPSLKTRVRQTPGRAVYQLIKTTDKGRH